MDVQCLSLNQNFKMTKSSQNGIDGRGWVNSCFFSDEHSSLVANVRNLSTGYISTQFHLVFDDLFETVICTVDDEVVFDAICNDLFDLNRDWYAGDELMKMISSSTAHHLSMTSGLMNRADGIKSRK